MDSISRNPINCLAKYLRCGGLALSKDALREIEKLRVRLNGLEKAEDQARISFELCLDKWQRLVEGLNRGEISAVSQEVLLGLRIEAYEALGDALEKQSRREHEGSHVAEGLGLLLLYVEKAFQDHLQRSRV